MDKGWCLSCRGQGLFHPLFDLNVSLVGLDFIVLLASFKEVLHRELNIILKLKRPSHIQSCIGPDLVLPFWDILHSRGTLCKDVEVPNSVSGVDIVVYDRNSIDYPLDRIGASFSSENTPVHVKVSEVVDAQTPSYGALGVPCYLLHVAQVYSLSSTESEQVIKIEVHFDYLLPGNFVVCQSGPHLSSKMCIILMEHRPTIGDLNDSSLVKESFNSVPV